MARILIVEDEPLISMMLEEWLCEIGHEPVGPATTVDTAMALCEAGGFDIALLDLHLHGQRCDAVADILMARGVPFAFATGGSIDTVDPRYADRPTLAKPYGFDALQIVIRNLLERCRDAGGRVTANAGSHRQTSPCDS